MHVHLFQQHSQLVTIEDICISPVIINNYQWRCFDSLFKGIDLLWCCFHFCTSYYLCDHELTLNTLVENWLKLMTYWNKSFSHPYHSFCLYNHTHQEPYGGQLFLEWKTGISNSIEYRTISLCATHVLASKIGLNHVNIQEVFPSLNTVFKASSSEVFLKFAYLHL